MYTLEDEIFVNGVQATFQDRVTRMKKELEHANIYQVENFADTLIELSRLFDDLNLLFEKVDEFKQKRKTN